MKYFVNIIALILLALVVFGAIIFKESDTYYRWRNQTLAFFDRAEKFINQRKANIALETKPPRKRPLTFIEQEEILSAYIPNVFGNLSQEDWTRFWDLIYKPISPGKGNFIQKRYLSKDEVERYLIDNYPDPFLNFSREYWHDFWQIARVNWADE